MPDVTTPPILIDVSAQESAQVSGQFQNPYFQGPFKVGTNLYCVLQSTLPPGTIFNINVFKSTDGGLTWTQMDSANSPTTDQTVTFARVQAILNPDGTTITISYPKIAGLAVTTLSFVTFDTNTDFFTSGVIPDVVASAGYDFVIRLNSEIVLVYQKFVAPNVLETSIGLVVLSAGVWSAFTVIAAGDDATILGWTIPAMVLDQASGIAKCFMRKNFASLINTYYFEINAANSFTVPTQITAGGTNDRPNYGRPLIFNDSVCLPVFNIVGGGSHFTMTVLIGTPLSAPVFTGTDIDTGITTLFDVEAGQLTVDGSTLWALWIFSPDNTALKLRRSTNDGSGWTAIQDFYDLFTNPPNSLPPDQQFMTAMNVGTIGSLGAIITTSDAANNSIVSYFLFAHTTPPPPIVVVTSLPTGGGGRYISVPHCTIPPPGKARYKGCGRKPEWCTVPEREWVDMVYGAIAFNPQKAILLPAPIDGDVLIFSFIVPIGYDGMLLGRYNTLTKFFVEGSGDLVWRIRANGRYLRDCGNITVTMGSSKRLMPVPGGLQLRSGNFVEVLTAAPNTSGSLPAPGDAYVTAGLHGWYWPRK